jgi:hypothetical protein
VPFSSPRLLLLLYLFLDASVLLFPFLQCFVWHGGYSLVRQSFQKFLKGFGLNCAYFVVF